MNRLDSVKIIADKQVAKLEDAIDRALTLRPIPKKYEYMFLGDIKTLLKLYSFVAWGEFSKAARLAHNMDTEPRELIVNSVYSFLEDYM